MWRLGLGPSQALPAPWGMSQGPCCLGMPVWPTLPCFGVLVCERPLCTSHRAPLIFLASRVQLLL